MEDPEGTETFINLMEAPHSPSDNRSPMKGSNKALTNTLNEFQVLILL